MLFRKIYNKVPIAIQDQDLNCQMGVNAVFGSFVKFLQNFDVKCLVKFVKFCICCRVVHSCV